MQPRTTLRAVCLNLATAGHTVGYLPGAGDSVAKCLTEMGYAVTPLTSDDLDADKLKKFDAVVIGVRAFNVRPDLAKKAEALFDYAAAGGTVVEQYNRPEGLRGQIAPYPLRLSTSRITDETATMTFLAPDHPVLNRPNKITAADFDGWGAGARHLLPDAVGRPLDADPRRQRPRRGPPRWRPARRPRRQGVLGLHRPGLLPPAARRRARGVPAVCQPRLAGEAVTGDPPDDDAHTGLPVLKTWPALYVFVAGALVVYVVGLALLSGWSR